MNETSLLNSKIRKRNGGEFDIIAVLKMKYKSSFL